MSLGTTTMAFSAPAIAVMLRLHDIGEPHLALRDGDVWVPPETRREVEQAAWREFADHGLVDGHGELRDSVLTWLPALSRPTEAYTLWVRAVEWSAAFLLAPLGDHGVLAVLQDNQVFVEAAGGASPVEALVCELPRARPAQGRAMNLRLADLHSGRGPDVQRYLNLAHTPPTALAEFSVDVRDHLGRTRTAAEPVRIRTVGDESWLVKTSGDYVTVVPASPRLIAEAVYELRRSLRW